MKESYLDYKYEFFDPKSDWLFITPSAAVSDLMIVPQECGRFIMNGSHHTERGPLDSYQIAFNEHVQEGFVLLDGVKYSYAGDNNCMFLDCRRGYRIESYGPNLCSFIHFFGSGVEYYASLFKKYNGGDPTLHKYSQIVKDGIAALVQMYKQPNSINTDIAAEMIITEMMVELVRRAMPDANKGYSEYVQAAIDYINAHYAESLTLDGIAEEVYISKYYLSHIFKRETGVTPINFLQQLRISKAKELLRMTNMSQEAICCKVGLYNCSYLSKLFRAYEGITPNQYRENWL